MLKRETKEDFATISQQSRKYIDSKKEVYNSILNYLESSDFNEEDFQHLITVVNSQQNEKSKEEYEHFLYMIEHISSNHHRDELFMKKIFQIVQYYKTQIKQTLSNSQIFNIFKTNKILLLFLIENEIITLDKDIFHAINYTYENNGNRYRDFFYPEIKKFLGKNEIKEIESNLLSKGDQIFEIFDEKRHKGENDSYICTLIRQDLVDDFIIHVNQKNID